MWRVQFILGVFTGGFMMKVEGITWEFLVIAVVGGTISTILGHATEAKRNNQHKRA